MLEAPRGEDPGRKVAGLPCRALGVRPCDLSPRLRPDSGQGRGARLLPVGRPGRRKGRAEVSRTPRSGLVLQQPVRCWSTTRARSSVRALRVAPSPPLASRSPIRLQSLTFSRLARPPAPSARATVSEALGGPGALGVLCSQPTQRPKPRDLTLEHVNSPGLAPKPFSL